jgi:hypothetical protein
VARITRTLPLVFYVQHQALDRKLRKIVKNRYRYVRRYVYIQPSDRLRLGLRLCAVARMLYGGPTWAYRLRAMVEAYMENPATSLISVLHRRHQEITLRALGLR